MSLVVLSTISCYEALIELVPEYEHVSCRKLDVTYAGLPRLTEEIRGGNTADLFILSRGVLQSAHRLRQARRRDPHGVLAVIHGPLRPCRAI